MIRLTQHPIDTEWVLKSVQSTQAGAAVLFFGDDSRVDRWSPDVVA